jgi:hypothetical protein
MSPLTSVLSPKENLIGGSKSRDSTSTFPEFFTSSKRRLASRIGSPSKSIFILSLNAPGVFKIGTSEITR